jgi:hypothetical protein
MKFNKWTLGLAAVGAVSLASAVRADEPKMNMVQTALSSTTISGYVDVAAQYNLGNQPANDNAYYNSSKVDNFSLNNVTISLDKPLDESPWASGYHVDLNFGQDAINGFNGGYYDSIYDGQFNNNYAVRQAYVTLRTPVGNGIDWKIGAFDGVTGYEANTDYLNPNYTRSYGYAVNPASEVGLLGAYKITDLISVQAGIANRSSGNYSNVSSKDYIATIALTAPDSWGWLKGSTLNAGTVQTFDNGGINNYNVSATLATPVTGLKVGLAYDNVQSLQASDDGNIYGIYGSFQATDKLSLNLRGEYVDASSSSDLPFFNNGKGEEITATVEYDLWANVVSRAEFRWDHAEHGTQFATAGSTDAENAYLLALNVIYKF